MITILVTSVEPFESDLASPSWDIVQALDDTQVDGTTIVARRLPCVFGLANKILVDTIEVTSPVLVFALGLATGRTEISVGRVAINMIGARIPDNAGNQPVDTPVVADGSTAYFSTLPIKAIVHALHGAGVPADVSQNVGTYNCNHPFYGLMHHIAIHAPRVRGGFIHVPTTSELTARHAGRPSLSIDTQIRRIRLVVHTTPAMQSNLKMNTDTVH